MRRDEGGRVAGLLLAAGAGRRMGGPKALVRFGAETLVQRGWRMLGDAGVDPRLVVLGDGHVEARRALPPGADTVLASDWADGMGASLRAGLAALDASDVRAVLVTLVDMPFIGATAVRRVVGATDAAPSALARGTFDGAPGHPVLLGRAHWEGVAAGARGDAGARVYLRGRRDIVPVEISDVADPADLATPDDLRTRSRTGRARDPGHGPAGR